MFVTSDLDHKRLYQWFSTGDAPVQGSVNEFTGGREALRALQHGKFDRIYTFMIKKM